MKYHRVVQWSTEGDSIRLEMLGEDQKTHQVDVSAECAAAVVAALGTQLARIDSAGRDQQFVRPASMQTGQTHDGEPMIVLTLVGGTELPLVFKPASLNVLIAELEKLRAQTQGGAQIRWN